MKNLNLQEYPDITTAHGAAAVKWISEMSVANCWNLTDEEVAKILGGVSLSNYLKLKNNAKEASSLEASKNILLSISILLGIWKCLQLVVPQNRRDLAYAWFDKSNSSELLRGKSIKQYLIEHQSNEALCAVRSYLEKVCV